MCLRQQMHAVVSDVQKRLHLRRRSSADGWSFAGKLQSIRHAEERDQTDAVGQKHQWVFNLGWP